MSFRVSLPYTLISNSHGKKPENIQDVKQLVRAFTITRPSIITGDFNFDAKKNKDDIDLLKFFTDSLPNYHFPDIGGLTSDVNKKLSGKYSTSRKVRGYETVQNSKFNVIKESRKDLIGYDTKKYYLESTKAFPDLSELNTLSWPADHQCITAVLVNRNTYEKILVVSLNKVPVWRPNEWNNEYNYVNFGENINYFPSIEDNIFHDVINCVYDKISNNVTCWNDFFKLCNTDEMGMKHNKYVSEWSKPDDRKFKKYTYPTVTKNNDGSYKYHCWSFKKFINFLEVDPLNKEKYKIKNFKDWSCQWFLYTGYIMPVEGGGTYSIDNNNNKNHKWLTVGDNGVNLGMRIYQYMMSWFSLYKLNQHPCITNNIENFSKKIKYKRSFISTYGSLDKSKPSKHFPKLFNTEKHNEIILERMINEIKDKIDKSDMITINIQEDWKFNEFIKTKFEDSNNYINIDNRFEIKHLWKSKSQNTKNVDVSILFLKKHISEEFMSQKIYNYEDEYVLPNLEGETTINNKRNIDTFINKSIFFQLEDDFYKQNKAFNYFIDNYPYGYMKIITNMYNKIRNLFY